MNNKQKAAFYVGAAVYKDLDSNEVDRILEAAGLHTDIHPVGKCVQAVKNALHHTPAGPVADWQEIDQKIKKHKSN